MSEIVQWINDPINYPLDTRWEDLPVELRVPPIKRTALRLDAQAIQDVMANTMSFLTLRDAVMAYALAFLPEANCWIKDVRIVEHDGTYKHPKGAWAAWLGQQSLSCSDDEPDDCSEPLPEDLTCQEPAEPPDFWSEEDLRLHMEELREIQKEEAALEWDMSHPEARCPPRE